MDMLPTSRVTDYQNRYSLKCSTSSRRPGNRENSCVVVISEPEKNSCVMVSEREPSRRDDSLFRAFEVDVVIVVMADLGEGGGGDGRKEFSRSIANATTSGENRFFVGKGEEQVRRSTRKGAGEERGERDEERMRKGSEDGPGMDAALSRKGGYGVGGSEEGSRDRPGMNSAFSRKGDYGVGGNEEERRTTGSFLVNTHSLRGGEQKDDHKRGKTKTSFCRCPRETSMEEKEDGQTRTIYVESFDMARQLLVDELKCDVVVGVGSRDIPGAVALRDNSFESIKEKYIALVFLTSDDARKICDDFLYVPFVESVNVSAMAAIVLHRLFSTIRLEAATVSSEVVNSPEMLHERTRVFQGEEFGGSTAIRIAHWR